MKNRILIITAAFFLLWTLILARSAYLQFFSHDKLTQLQNRQFLTTINVNPRRGAIVDRKGRDIAMSTLTYSLYADPQVIENKKTVAKKISPLIQLRYSEVFKKIKPQDRRFVWIKRWMSKQEADRIKKLKIHGLGFVEEWRRVYPNDTLLSSVVGFLGNEGQGLEGLELMYNTSLRGEPQKIKVRRDARGRPLSSDAAFLTEAPEGKTLQLTVDFDLQYKLESELKYVTDSFAAESAMGIILDAKTSAIRAIAATPGYNLNQALKISPEHRRNKVITDTFEPGSTMKTFVIAGGLREKKLQPNTKYFCEYGHYVVGDKVIREAETNEKFGDLTATEILAVSSNIGTTKIAFQLGAEKLRQTLLDFGFGEKTNIDLPGENKGQLLPLPWRQHTFSNVSFGHAMTATALQIANAYAAIANGGVLHSPFIVHEQKEAAKPIRRVLTAEESLQMRMMLAAAAAPGGTGVNARVDGYIVAGKTGTAQMVNPKGRGYLPGQYISSFAGFIPANDPQFVIYVAIQAPQKAYYGSAVAAPLFSRLASYAVRQEGIPPQLATDKTWSLSSIYSQNKIETAQKKAFEKIQEREVSSTEKLEFMPDLKGLSLREVLRFSQTEDQPIKLKGNGILVEATWPSAGEPLPKETPITIFMR